MRGRPRSSPSRVDGRARAPTAILTHGARLTTDPEEDLDRPTSRSTAFRRGLAQRNPLVLAAAAVLCLLALAGAQHFFFEGGLTAIPESRLLRHDHDDQVHVAYSVNQLKEHPPQGRVVYIFGGSGAMEAVSGDRSLAAQIERRAGEPVTVVGLANHAQSLAQNLVIVDNLPAGEATLLVGLAPMRFNTSPHEDQVLLASRTLLLRSSRLRELASELFGREAPWTGGLSGAFDYVSAYVRERLSGGPLPGRRVRYLRHYYGRDAPAQDRRAKRASLDSVYEYNRTHYAANHEYNLVVLRELVRLAREKGFDVAFFEQPLNTDVAGDWAGVLPMYRAEAGRIARVEEVPYLRIERSLRLSDADFVDLYHLLSTSRARWERQMAREIAGLLRATEVSTRWPRGGLGASPK